MIDLAHYRDRLSEKAQELVSYAIEESQRRQHYYLGVEHLFLGLCKVADTSLETAMVRAGFDRPIDMSSTRAGSIPGVHTIGFDGPSDTIELTHTARDRRGFAAGALLAAKWIHGRTGWYSTQDVLRNAEG